MNDESDIVKQNKCSYIIIHGYHCLSEKYPLFYDSHGFIINEWGLQQQLKEIKEIQMDLNSTTFIVGYFKFTRSDSSLSRTTTSSTYDENLLNGLSKKIPSIHHPLIMAFINESNESSTRTYTYSFWDAQSSQKNLPVHVVNISDNDLTFRQFISSIPITIPPFPENLNENEMVPYQNIPLVKEYSEFYQKHMNDLQKATEKVIMNELTLLALKQEIEQIKNRQ
ncbi:unnamed protein product [Cunninghamella blakesleeana]